jgi:hypothetical protein
MKLIKRLWSMLKTIPVDIELKIKMITIILKILKKKKRTIFRNIFIQIIQKEKKYLIG